MIPRAAPDASPLQRLTDGLEQVAAAPTREAVLCAASALARELAYADAVCALPEGQANALLSLAGDPEVRSLSNAAPLRQLVAISANDRARVIEQQLELELPDQPFSAQAVSVVPLGTRSTYIAVLFFWHAAPIPGAGQLALLPTLAWAICMALQSRQKDEQLRQHLEQHRSEALELQHRVRNVLALVRSIIRRSSYAGASAEDFSSHLEARVSAVARTQSWLSIDGHGGSDLEDLVRTELTANAARDTHFTIAGPPVRLSTRGTETMALAFHELTTNALKFGALAEPDGHIDIAWSIDRTTTPPRLRWRWSESGVGVTAAVPQRRGFGQELLERVLPYELGARTTLTFVPGGVQCEIDLPLNERTAAFGHADSNPNEDRSHDD